MTAKELYEKYQSDLKKLQSRCKHVKQSDWISEQWAPAHLTGYMVKVCERCNKVVDRKSMGWDFTQTVTITE